ncbi:MAG: 50S ribosomal protein L32e [Candidatus Verstraetearchaeota archaeon]|nr:50S ribosomal protein L32e [Candidatus Verstraetearchaeota archaeon]
MPKASLDPELARLFKLKEFLRRTRPKFRRANWWRFPRLGECWRKPRGPRNKMRLKLSGRPAIVEPGYRGPVKVRGFHPCGLKEVLVHSVKELEGIDPEKYVVRIAGTVGAKKRREIYERALQLGFHVLNPPRGD